MRGVDAAERLLRVAEPVVSFFFAMSHSFSLEALGFRSQRQGGKSPALARRAMQTISVLSDQFLNQAQPSIFGDFQPDDEPEEMILRRGDAIDVLWVRREHEKNCRAYQRPDGLICQA